MSKESSILESRGTSRRVSVRDAFLAVGVAVLALLLLTGDGVREAGERMERGAIRTAVLAVGHPAGWVADQLPFDEGASAITGWLSPDDELAGPGGFEDEGAPAPRGGGVSGITPDAFDPAEFGERARPLELGTLLVTGDSLAQPLDAELARRFADDGVETVRDVHLGTGISKTDLLDWGRLSRSQVRDERPDAVVVFLGANEGFPIGDDECCSREWAVAYATRARRVMETYGRGGAARIYWLTLPATRDPDLARIARTVNAGIEVASQPLRAVVRVVDLEPVFTPEGRYRDAIELAGRETIVREPDGVHLNAAGSREAADIVEALIRADFGGR